MGITTKILENDPEFRSKIEDAYAEYLNIGGIEAGELIRKLAGFDPPLFRLRSGRFRAYFRIRGDEIVVLAVTRRKAGNKRLKRIAEEPVSGDSRARDLSVNGDASCLFFTGSLELDQVGRRGEKYQHYLASEKTL